MIRLSMLVASVAGAALSILAATDAAQQDAALSTPYENHQWFELRDAASRVAAVPPFYRAALACVFHDALHCESAVQSVLAARPAPSRAYELHELLSQFYFRAGRYRRAAAELDAMLTIRPEAADVVNARPLLLALSRERDQETISVAPSVLPVHVSNQNFPLPIRINGKAAEYFFDTGANLSVMSASEAKRLGLRIHDVSTRVFNTPGDAIGVRVATADELVVGNARLKQVAFLIFRDDEEPFSELPPTRRGAIGLPVLLAFGSLSWGADRFEIGAPAPTGVESNLGFDGALPIVRLSVEGKALAFNLDTGAEDTMLWPPFAREFPAMIERSGLGGTTAVAGVGSSRDVESIDLPQLRLVLGGRSVTLAPASVLLKATTSDTTRRFGNLGLDLLNQARRTTIDFRTMTLTLDGGPTTPTLAQGDVPPVTCTIAPDKTQPLAVASPRHVFCGLDLGSNNVKLIVLSVEDGHLERARDERQCRSRLGLGAQAFDQATAAAKAVPPMHVDRLITVVKEMQGLCQRDGGHLVGADATQWARDATNITEVKAAVRAATGVDMDVLSPSEEGRYGYISGARGQPGKVVIDPGSNSFQLAFQMKGASKIESISVPFGFVRAAAAYFANPSIPDYATARAQYVERVTTALDLALGQLTPPRSLAALKNAVLTKALDGDVVTMGQDGAIHLAVNGLIRPAGAWVTTQAAYDAQIKQHTPQSDPVYGEISARLPAARLADYVRTLTPADFLTLRTTPAREMYGERMLANPVLLDLIARQLGLTTIVVSPAEMPNGFVLSRVDRK